MNGYGKPCGGCETAARYATTLRCIRNAPRNANGDVTVAAVSGSPLCESERWHFSIIAPLVGTCGRSGRFWRERVKPEIREYGPTMFFLAVHEDFKGRRDVRPFATREERDAFVERITGDDLIYSAVDVEAKPRVP